MLKSLAKAPSFRDEPATVASALRAGIDSDNFTHSLALHHPVDPDIADVLTMLEVRRRFESFPHDCRSYAVEILLIVRAEIPTTSQPRRIHRKEPENAFA
jgi:hypothetical protein